MLYSFSQANYAQPELMRYFQYITEKDVVLLWQDGVLLALRDVALLENCKAPVRIVVDDVKARGLISKIPTEWLIPQSLAVELTEQVTPHFAI
ncbi:tRNA 2-thiouridine synthesizing protein B [Pasteurella langaaensis DSM 22999]|uniref:tRNA 2-thiouridine synthesizing protein B n=1 Tax=Alitibacter langaaensis DSM 22999 TaxID=1122935 RepID=A0A2U0TGE4_9PAST|nr:DsrH/TusB family sulfur metabolism protein [Pasteurella langaaensis]PVX42685.1 tRNA 2-thiouridine synthesizing protein B [Pasteurella langaaensis DSM 22999]